MARFVSRREWIALSVLGLLSANSSGCGILLYPERRGQPAGRLDWGVVLLDAIGLFFFFIPGVIAFAVDFATGTIYLPPDRYGSTGGTKPGKLVPVKSEVTPLTPEVVEQVVARHTGKTVNLRTGDYHTRELSRINDYWTVRAEFEQV